MRYCEKIDAVSRSSSTPSASLDGPSLKLHPPSTVPSLKYSPSQPSPQEIKGDFENIASVTARDDNEWSIDIKNPLNDYEERKNVTIRASELQEMENEHQAPVNFAVKWEGANKQSTLSIMSPGDKALRGKKKQPSNASRPVTESETWTPVFAVDCRGLEPFR